MKRLALATLLPVPLINIQFCSHVFSLTDPTIGHYCPPPAIFFYITQIQPTFYACAAYATLDALRFCLDRPTCIRPASVPYYWYFFRFARIPEPERISMKFAGGNTPAD